MQEPNIDAAIEGLQGAIDKSFDAGMAWKRRALKAEAELREIEEQCAEIAGQLGDLCRKARRALRPLDEDAAAKIAEEEAAEEKFNNGQFGVGA